MPTSASEETGQAGGEIGEGRRGEVVVRGGDVAAVRRRKRVLGADCVGGAGGV